MGQRGHSKGRGLYFHLWKRERKSSIGKRIVFTSQNNISSYREQSLLVTGCDICEGESNENLKYCNTIVC